ncbi:MAG: TonB-dependent receptor [Acidobacteriota bacterium]|jgi:iron complex outermembrane receptor protein
MPFPSNRGTLILIAITAFLPLPLVAVDAPTGTITGVAVDADGEPVTGASVSLVQLRRRTDLDTEGRFRFDDVPHGTYVIEVVSHGEGSAVEEVHVEPGATVTLRVHLDLGHHREQVVVLGGQARGTLTTYEPLEVLDREELSSRMAMTLGETLTREAGVSSTYFGPGASRPVIRGLQSANIRILESGVGVGDASTTSPDHAVTVEPYAAEKVEVIRGTATLLYGSTAVGGVVNVLDNRIPQELPESPVTGTLDLRAGTVADERSAGLVLDGRGGPIGWHLDGTFRDTGDYAIPGAADVGGGGSQGVLDNSSIRTETGTVGASWVGDAGYVGASYRDYSTNYGIPASIEEPAPGEEDAGVRIDMQQRRIDLDGAWTRPLGGLRGIHVRAGRADYEHRELEGEEVGTTFRNDAWEGRLELPHDIGEKLSGTAGVQLASRRLEAIGEEAFLPPSETDTYAAFWVEEVRLGDSGIKVGLRYESASVTTEMSSLDRDFDGLSGALGYFYSPRDRWAIAVDLSRTTQFPTAEQLFSDGPHLATFSYEIGDPDLGTTGATGLDVSLRTGTGRVTGELSLFATRFDGFVYEMPTGQEMDGLPVFRFTQDDAEFLGGELHGDIQLWHREPHHVILELRADYVRAELTATGEPLPFIPPLRYGLGVRYEGRRFWGGIEAYHAAEQDRVPDFVTPTAAYTLVNADVGVRFLAGGVVQEIRLIGTNLTDEDARNAVSRLKDQVPLPGRNISLGYRLLF